MSQKALRILLIHDPAGRRPTTCELLLQTDLTRFELDSIGPARASEGFRQNHYDVCIVDSPDLGIELLQESARFGFAAPIIMLTSNSAAEVLEAMRHGAADCLIRETLSSRAIEESICLVIETARTSEHEAEYARRYICLTEQANEIIYTHDLQGTSTFINRAGQQLTDYRLEEVVGRNFRELISPECVDTLWLAIQQLLANRRQSSCDAVLLSKEGRQIPVRVTMHLVYKEGNPVGIQGIAHDMRVMQSHLIHATGEERVSLLL